MQNEFMTIRQCAKAGPIAEHRLRIWQKEGKLPGVYSGNRFLINRTAFLDLLNRLSTANTTTGEGNSDA